MNDTLSKLKTYLGIPEDKTDFDGVLKLIIDNTELQLKVKLGLFDDFAQVPYELSYIPLQVEVNKLNLTLVLVSVWIVLSFCFAIEVSIMIEKHSIHPAYGKDPSSSVLHARYFSSSRQYHLRIRQNRCR